MVVSTIALGVGAGIFLFVVSVVFMYNSASKRLKRLLRKVELSTSLDHSLLLKEEYLEIYKLYLKLPEKQKSYFYARVISVRSILEDQLKAQKRLEVLVTQVDSIDASSKKTLLEEIEDNYRKLSEKEKEKYTPMLLHLREEVVGISSRASSINPSIRRLS